LVQQNLNLTRRDYVGYEKLPAVGGVEGVGSIKDLIL